ncbi:RHS repeat-associated protein [Luteibacter rhizovicinus]|uniref:RHS repeat-associated protein n=1 Tax=Luteibacter rhizovicinus TaxID=242606 RepID=A0A4R3YHE4_9GAMM|nr:RHS repeat-associated protein [Luteibacter rhizovicinus]
MLGGTTAGVGYAGHVFDDDSNLVYMQQRYYDPQIGRFLSIDPVAPDGSTRANFNRYKYATNNPYKFVDPDGRYDRLVWTSSNTVNVVIPYAISDSNGVARFTSAQVDADIAKRLSGSVSVNGVTVNVIAVPVNVPLDSPEVASGKANVINVDPTVTRSFTNKIGGDKIALNANALPGEVSHEITHTAGGGDQYPGGVDVSGHWIPATSPALAGTLMGDMQGAANSQTFREVVTSPTAEVHCLSGASAPTGACQ